jgi:hypothetical protein
MVQDIWLIWIWAISGGGPFMWTVVASPGTRDVTAEATLAKVVMPATAGDKHAKATVWASQFGPITSTGTGVQQSTTNWGIDGSPIRDLPNCSSVWFALEVNGLATFAQMTGKIYFR